MSETARERLPGASRTLVGSARLYLGPDHILEVRSTRLTEDYRRFGFQDIQAITIRKTAPFHYVWAGVLALVALLAGRFVALPWLLGIVAVGAVFLWLRGPSCAVRLRTAVSDERLSSLHSLKTARRVIEVLRQSIESTQGRVADIPDFLPAPAPPPLAPTPMPPPVASGQKWDHIALFGFLAVEAALMGIWLLTGDPLLERIVAVATLIEFLALTIVLVRQSQTAVPRPIRMVTFAATARWFLLQALGTVVAYKAVLIDRTAIAVDPLTVGRGWQSQLTFVSLLVTACAGLWASLRRSDE